VDVFNAFPAPFQDCSSGAVVARMVVFTMPNETLLLIEDDPEMRLALRLALEDEDYRVIEAANAERGLAAFAEETPDLVLLDLRLPDRRGLDVCRELRAHSIVPIIIVTAQTDTHDLVAGLEAGADDYVTKPVVPKALAARIRAMLRRVALHQQPADPASPESQPSHEPRFIEHIEIRESEALVLLDNAPIELTKTELRLLCELADHPNQVLSRDQLLERVWGYDFLGDSRLVDAHMYRLRNKVERNPAEPTLIMTVRGLGYKLQIGPSA
jgi:DNA-binding response OmpR family regulator